MRGSASEARAEGTTGRAPVQAGWPASGAPHGGPIGLVESPPWSWDEIAARLQARHDVDVGPAECVVAIQLATFVEVMEDAFGELPLPEAVLSEMADRSGLDGVDVTLWRLSARFSGPAPGFEADLLMATGTAYWRGMLGAPVVAAGICREPVVGLRISCRRAPG